MQDVARRPCVGSNPTSIYQYDKVEKIARKQKILGIISKKQDAELLEKPVDELIKLVEEL